MEKLTDSHLQHQKQANIYFESVSSYWKDIYARPGVYAEIHRHRRSVVLNFIDGLTLAPGNRVLEVGCGAGSMAARVQQP